MRFRDCLSATARRGNDRVPFSQVPRVPHWPSGACTPGSAEKELVEIKEKGAQLDTAAAVSVALSVKLIKALIVSRSGKTAKAPNNKDRALARELMAMMTNPRVLLTPPTSATSTSPRAMDDDEKVAGQFDPKGGDFAFRLTLVREREGCSTPALLLALVAACCWALLRLLVSLFGGFF